MHRHRPTVSGDVMAHYCSVCRQKVNTYHCIGYDDPLASTHHTLEPKHAASDGECQGSNWPVMYDAAQQEIKADHVSLDKDGNITVSLVKP